MDERRTEGLMEGRGDTEDMEDLGDLGTRDFKWKSIFFVRSKLSFKLFNSLKK